MGFVPTPPALDVVPIPSGLNYGVLIVSPYG